MQLALIIPLMLLISGCIQEKLVDTIDTADKKTLQPFGVSLGVDKYLNGKKSASDWLAVGSYGNIKGSSDYYYTVYVDVPEKNENFSVAHYYVDKLTNTIVGLGFLETRTENEEIHQMEVFAKILSNTLDEKYQDFFTFKGHYKFGAYEIRTSKIQDGRKAPYTKKFYNSDAAEKYIDQHNKTLTGSPFAYDGLTLGDYPFNPRTTYRYYSKFMNELNRIDDIKIIFRSTSRGGYYDIPFSHSTYLTYSLSSEYVRTNYASKWNKAVRDALSKHDSDINSARLESEHY